MIVGKINTLKTGNDRTKLQALALINDCYKCIMDLTTNGVVITDAIIQTNKEKLTMSTREENGNKESKEPGYNEDDQPEEKQKDDELNKTSNVIF